VTLSCHCPVLASFRAHGRPVAHGPAHLRQPMQESKRIPRPTPA